MEFRAVILAAGQGKRMRSRVPKVLHSLAGRPMIRYVLDTVRELGLGRPVVVTAAREAAVRDQLAEEAEYALQESPLGTAHALAAAAPFFPSGGNLLVLCGDTPLLTAADLTPLLEAHRAGKVAATLLTTRLADPYGYGRVVRDREGKVLRIVEQRDATPEEAAIQEVNTGVYCFRVEPLREALSKVRPDNAQGEYYLTDCVAELAAAGESVGAVRADDPRALEGVNDRHQLARAAGVLHIRILERLRGAGVTIISPEATGLDWDISAGDDTVIWTGATLLGHTRIGRGCHIGPQAMLRDAEVGDGVRVGPGTVISPGTGRVNHVRV